mmetsp:Transcript_8919/g.11213  ORF Transcript_8919/g.11213 Transcript_8919/m.11213 type:complete len:360 (+) Transcript_8919:13-1092(+)
MFWSKLHSIRLSPVLLLLIDGTYSFSVQRFQSPVQTYIQVRSKFPRVESFPPSNQQNLIFTCNIFKSCHDIGMVKSNKPLCQTKQHGYDDILSPKPNSFLNYRLVSITYLAVSLFILFMPHRDIQYNSVKFRNNPVLVGGASGYGIAAVVSYILHDLSTKECINKLNISTASTLNFGLLIFSLLGLFVVPGEAAFHENFQGSIMLFMMMITAKWLGIFISYRGFISLKNKDGNQIVQKQRRTLSPRMQNIYSSLQKFFRLTTEPSKERDAKVYQVMFILCYICLGNNVLCLVHSLLMNSPSIPLSKSLYLSAIARLSLISTIILTLKEAANETRLSEHKFIVLNLALAIWAFSGMCATE